DRADRSAEHVVEPAELARALDGRDVLRILDDADQLRVAARVAADAAALLLGDVAAHFAELHSRAHLGEQLGEPDDIEGRRLQDMERDPLRGLRADAWQPAELVDELLDDSVVHQLNLAGGS